MLHHVGIEVRPEEVERAVELFELLGFEQVQPPPTLSEFTWLEREGTQIHLMPEPSPTAAPRGHFALVTPELETTLERLRQRGFELEERRNHWGSPRFVVLAPGGHRVELMAFPPS
jgi:catechol 2,3-dioxygenase-like lactoylglutathione lyase family enzyme